jgi:hypothetical protein
MMEQLSAHSKVFMYANLNRHTILMENFDSLSMYDVIIGGFYGIVAINPQTVPKLDRGLGS